MAFPESVDDFERLAVAMRKHGAIQAFGVVLGPEPTKSAKLELEAKERTLSDTERQELAEERLRLRQEQAREDLRLELGASGRTFTDEQLDRMIGPIA